MPCRGVRGAITVEENTADAIRTATIDLLGEIEVANRLQPADVSAVLFSVTPDLTSAFPASAARAMGWTQTALLDVREADVQGDLPRCIRVMLLWNTDRTASEVRHVYLRGAGRLRPDLASEAAQTEEATPLPPGQVWTAPAEMAAQLFGEASPREDPQTPKPADNSVVVAYQGEPGAYSQEAIYQHFGPGVETLACRSFEGIIEALESKQSTCSLLPVENSQAGSINQAFDLLLDRDVRVVGEVKLRVRHCLLAPPGTNLEEIKRVQSHPQALAQCEKYLAQRGWEPVPAYDTAGAAKLLAASGEAHTAAIASALAGETYGLQLLDRGIEDSPYNTTRFFLLGRTELPPAQHNKTSLVFATTNSPGALYNALGEFALRGINLNKIESRPRRNRPWHYVFYVDIDGHWRDAQIQQALLSLLTRAAFVKLLGSYPAAPETTIESSGEAR